MDRSSTRKRETLELDLADRDDLTGLANRRFLTRLLKTRWPGLLAEVVEVSLVIIDLDFFKQVNDSYGHTAGDAVLQTAARLLRENFREDDLVVRYGGDEFVVVLPGAGAAEAAVLAERARETLSSEELLTGPGGEPIEVAVTFSLGIASAPSDGVDGMALLDRADRRLYREKRRRHSRALATLSPRDWLVGAIAVAALALAVVAVALRRGEAPAPTEPLPAAREPIVLPEPDERSTERQVEALQAQLAELSRVLTEAENADEQSGVEGRVAELEATIARLQLELEEQRKADLAEEQAGLGLVETTVADPLPPEEPRPDERSPTASVEAHEPDPEPPTVLVPPRLLEMPAATYPELGRIARRGATVRVEVLVGADGTVDGAVILGEESGFGFEEAALEAARQAVFEPGTRDGEPMPMRIVISVRFSR